MKMQLYVWVCTPTMLSVICNGYAYCQFSVVHGNMELYTLTYTSVGFFLVVKCGI